MSAFENIVGLGVFVGIIAGANFYGILRNKSARTAKILLGNDWLAEDGSLTFRNRQLLPLRPKLLLTMSLAMLLNPLGLAGFGGGNWQIAFAIYVVLLVSVLGFLIAIALSGTFRLVQRELVRTALSQTMRLEDQRAARKVVEHLLPMNQLDLLLLLPQYLGDTPGSWAEEELEQLLHHEASEVRVAAEAALSKRYALRDRNKGLGLAGLHTLLQDYGQWTLGKTLVKKDRLRIAGLRIDVLEERIFDQLTPQIPLKEAFPDVFCVQCHSRVARGTQDGWWWLSCKVCDDDDHLFPGIHKAIGQIGGPIEPSFYDGIYRFNIWKEVDKEPVLAEIDGLEIFGGDLDNYDWAVSKVVGMLELRHPEKIGNVAVQLIGNPALEGNSLRILQRLDEKFKEGQT